MKEDIIKLEYVKTHDQLGDLMTKNLGRNKFTRLTRTILEARPLTPLQPSLRINREEGCQVLWSTVGCGNVEKDHE